MIPARAQTQKPRSGFRHQTGGFGIAVSAPYHVGVGSSVLFWLPGRTYRVQSVYLVAWELQFRELRQHGRAKLADKAPFGGTTGAVSFEKRHDYTLNFGRIISAARLGGGER
jgi:hypothetical protein